MHNIDKQSTCKSETVLVIVMSVCVSGCCTVKKKWTITGEYNMSILISQNMQVLGEI